MIFPPSLPQLLADLAWLLLGPSLLAPNAQVQVFSDEQAQQIKGWLLEQEVYWYQEHSLPPPNPKQHQYSGIVQATPPMPISAACQEAFGLNKYLRLGRYAEKLLLYFLKHFPGYQVHAYGLALNSGQAGVNTTGEIDYLLQDPQGKHWHWELAVKFFVCDGQATRGPEHSAQALAQHFHGPDRKEAFTHKLLKMFARQLAHQAPAPFDHLPWDAQAFARGWMFYRWDEPVPSCSDLNPDHLKGFWMYWDELREGSSAMKWLAGKHPAPAASSAGIELASLDRAEWLSPKTAHSLTQTRVSLDSAPNLLRPAPEAPGRMSSAQMVAVLRHGQEVDRGFLLRRPANTLQ